MRQNKIKHTNKNKALMNPFLVHKCLKIKFIPEEGLEPSRHH